MPMLDRLAGGAPFPSPAAALDPAWLAVGPEADLVGKAGKNAPHALDHALRERRAVDQQAHLRVEVGRARIEVERSDEQSLLVDRKDLGMQAGGRAAGQPMHIGRIRASRLALALVQVDAG